MYQDFANKTNHAKYESLNNAWYDNFDERKLESKSCKKNSRKIKKL